MPAEPEIHEQAVLKTVEYLRDMQLLMPSDETIARRTPWSKGADGAMVIHRGLSVCPSPERYAPGTNKSEDIGYGVQVFDITPRDTSLTQGIANPTARKALIRRAFVHQKPVTLEGSNIQYCQTTVEPGRLYDMPPGIDKFEVSTFIIRFWIRESRS